MKYGAFDTETANRPGRGEAILLIRDEGEILEAPETWGEIFDFVGGKARLCWNMDFDVRAIFHPRFLPVKLVEDLGLLGRAAWGRYHAHYVPGKFFRVTYPGKPPLALYDLKQFYGTSLSVAAEKHLTNEKKAPLPRSWYSDMDGCLLDSRREKMLSYAVQDSRLVMRLGEKLFDGMSSAGVEIKAPTSCAAISRAMFGKSLAPLLPHPAVNRFFEQGFFGGRIECSALGSLGPSKLYDIHSAYPSVMHNMLSPDGDPVRVSRWSATAAYGCYRLRVDLPHDLYFGPLAYRRAEKVIYPVGRFDVWACRPAVAALRRAGLKFQVLFGMEVSSSGKRLFPELNEMYEKRKDPLYQYPYKIGPNSLYGIMAERREQSWDSEHGRYINGRKIYTRTSYGRYTNFVLASHVTESIRMRLWSTFHKFGPKVYFFATDGVLVSPEISLQTGPKLGDWGLEGCYPTSTVLGCGRYLLGGDNPKLHLRGFPPKVEIFEKLRKSKARGVWLSDLQCKSMKQYSQDPTSDANVLSANWRKFEICDDKRVWYNPLAKVSEAWYTKSCSLPFIIVGPGGKHDRHRGRRQAKVGCRKRTTKAH